MTSVSLLSIVLLVVLAACSETSNTTEIWELPQGLADCQVYKVAIKDSIGAMTVVRCPNSQTSVDAGKHDKIQTIEASVNKPTQNREYPCRCKEACEKEDFKNVFTCKKTCEVCSE